MVHSHDYQHACKKKYIIPYVLLPKEVENDGFVLIWTTFEQSVVPVRLLYYASNLKRLWYFKKIKNLPLHTGWQLKMAIISN